MKWSMRFLLGLLTIGGVAMGWVTAAHAFAPGFPIYGRGEYRGYFTDIYDCGGQNVFTVGIDPTVRNGENFIGFIEGHLRRGNAQHQVGAAFVIQTMLGGTDHGWPNPGEIADWESRIRSADAQGLVDWNVNRVPNYTYDVNSLFQGGPSAGSLECYPDVNPNDDAFYPMGHFETDSAVVFHDTDGSVLYALRMQCANPVGRPRGLRPADYNVQLNADRNGTPYNVIPGQSVNIGATLQNFGPAGSEVGTLQVQFPVGATVPCNPGGGACGVSPPDIQYGMLGGYDGPGGRGYRNGSGIPGVGGSNWYWSVAPIQFRGFTSTDVTFRISPNAVPGSLIFVDVYYFKGNRGGAVRHAVVPYRVAVVREPGVQGNNGDIHAGGGICNQAQSLGSIKTRPQSNSFGDYVVSASAANGINGLSSNTGAPAADKLRLGQNGAYAQVCRPDLVAAAQDYYNAGLGYTQLGAGVNTLDVTGREGVIFYRGARLDIHGTVSKKLTVVALSGGIRITGPIVLDGAAYPSRDVPSLGIIAAGDIRVHASVTRIDAYLFSNGTIDTCDSITGSCATPTLVVNGFLMSKTLELHRLAPNGLTAADAGPKLAEQVVLNPQIYLNPPKLFDATVDDNALQGQGERPPLF